jgi:hypothetical protein
MELVDLAIIDRKSGIGRRVGYQHSQSIERPFVINQQSPLRAAG